MVALRGLELGYMGLFCFFGWGRFASLPMSLFTTPMAHGPSTSKRSFCLKKRDDLFTPNILRLLVLNHTSYHLFVVVFLLNIPSGNLT